MRRLLLPALLALAPSVFGTGALAEVATADPAAFAPRLADTFGQMGLYTLADLTRRCSTAEDFDPGAPEFTPNLVDLRCLDQLLAHRRVRQADFVEALAVSLDIEGLGPLASRVGIELAPATFDWTVGDLALLRMPTDMAPTELRWDIDDHGRVVIQTFFARTGADNIKRPPNTGDDEGQRIQPPAEEGDPSGAGNAEGSAQATTANATGHPEGLDAGFSDCIGLIETALIILDKGRHTPQRSALHEQLLAALTPLKGDNREIAAILTRHEHRCEGKAFRQCYEDTFGGQA